MLYNKGFLKSSAINPLRCFLRGASEEDAIAVLERIKARYPQYDIYYRGYTEADPDQNTLHN
jgi:UDP-N-acetyl-D-mannosaminuronic acid transferase (WecB/TagA/CpsF family)